MVPFMSSVVAVLLVPPPQAATSAATNVSSTDHNPSRLPGILNVLPPYEISSGLDGTFRASG